LRVRRARHRQRPGALPDQVLPRLHALHPLRRGRRLPLSVGADVPGVRGQGRRRISARRDGGVHRPPGGGLRVRLERGGPRMVGRCGVTLARARGGAAELRHRTCSELGIRPGGTTGDGKFTVKPVECLAACGGAPAVQVNGEWLEHATEGDIDKVLAGQKLYRKFDWPKSPGEAILFRNAWKKDSASIETYKAGGGYANLKKYLSMTPE